ncbi:MAG: Thermoresistant gluconokinase [bacterium ADurb.Bin429]|nr:MAG: Thermoresistant gluconokinase [bacterium ADurb.Bin429]
MYLKGDPSLIRPRMETREGHYMPVSLLDSQFAALEEPENALTLDVSAPPWVLVRDIRRALGV